MTGLTTPQLIESAVRLHRAGNLPDARALYLEALEREPDRLDLLRLSARVAHDLGNSLQSAQLLRRAIVLAPSDAGLLVNLGMVLVLRRELDEAIAVLRQAVRLRPDSSEALSNLGAALRQHGQHVEAAAVLRRAVALHPDHVYAIVNLGAALTSLDQFDDAITALLRAISLRPSDPLAHYNLGVALKAAGHLEQAVESFDRALQLRPNDVEAITNRGDALHQLCRYDQAIAAFRAALAITPNNPSARTSLGLALLQAGDYVQGWPFYESRVQLPDWRKSRPLTQPQWDGRPMPGGRILLRFEQGLGDTMQFIRFAPLVAERGFEVILLCQPELRRLLAGQHAVNQVVTESDPLPPYDVYCHLLSLPALFQTTLTTIPGQSPYIHPDPALQDQWKAKISALPPAKLKIGLNWACGQRNRSDRARTVGLAAIAPLADVPGAQFYSLQKGAPASEAASPPPGMDLVDFSADLNDFADTAALLSCLDMVITCDTSVAHAAGALGIQTHILLPCASDPRWLLARCDSPWYPTVHLHRQPAAGDYNTPIIELARQLAASLGAE